MTVKCWLAVWKGAVAAELLGRLGDIDSLRGAALLIRETGRVGGGVVKRTGYGDNVKKTPTLGLRHCSGLFCGPPTTIEI